MAQQCMHLDQITMTQTDTHVCEECIKMGDRWVHLRMCLVCGHVGCCDNSKNRHATRHFQQSVTHSSDRLSRASDGSGAMWIRSCQANLMRERVRATKATTATRVRATQDPEFVTFIVAVWLSALLATCGGRVAAGPSRR